MPPTVHSEHGASKAERWMNCPGSVLLSRGIPDESSFYAREGTAAHEVLERALGQAVTPEAFLDHEIEVEGELITVTEEMCEAVQEAVDYTFRVMGVTEPAQLFLEERFDLAPLNPPAPMFGTSDVCVWLPESRHLHVLDYKHGQGVAVDAKENAQLLYYALGALVKLRVRPETITVHIMQPRGHHPAGPFRQYSLGFHELVEFKRELFAAAEETLVEGAPLSPGEWCRFCPALPTCPAQREHAIEIAQTEFDAVPVEDLKDALVAPEELTPEQLSLVLERGDILVQWIKAVNAHAVTALDRGEEIPGFKLVAGRANRRWIDEEAAEKYLAGKGLRIAERFSRKLVSPNQAEKALKAKGELGSARKLESLWEKPEGRPKLAPADSPKPALAPSVFDDFTATPEEG